MLRTASLVPSTFARASLPTRSTTASGRLATMSGPGWTFCSTPQSIIATLGVPPCHTVIRKQSPSTPRYIRTTTRSGCSGMSVPSPMDHRERFLGRLAGPGIGHAELAVCAVEHILALRPQPPVVGDALADRVAQLAGEHVEDQR